MKWVLSFSGLRVDSKFSVTNNVIIVHAHGLWFPQALVKISLKLSLLPSNGRSATRGLKKERNLEPSCGKVCTDTISLSQVIMSFI